MKHLMTLIDPRLEGEGFPPSPMGTLISLPLTKAKIEETLVTVGINPRRCAEALGLTEFQRLSVVLKRA